MEAADGPQQTKVVRRFTDELEPDSDLAIQTKRYQENRDTEIDLEERLRVGTVYYNQLQEDDSFAGVKLARETLQAKYTEFFNSISRKEAEQLGKRSFLGRKHRKSAEQRLAEEIHATTDFSVHQVNDLTDKLQTEWKASNSKVATNFRRICRGLDSHKQIFQCFPNQSMYTSVLCGAVTMIVKMGVNYSSIGEQLSTYVAELSDSISVCTKWINIHQTSSMKKRLSDIYTQFFEFFTKAATWYLKSGAAKLWDTFNESFLEDYKNAAATIKRHIQLINDEGNIENGSEVKSIKPHIDQVGQTVVEALAVIYAELRQVRKEAKQNEVGSVMRSLLLEMCQSPDMIVERHSPQNGDTGLHTIQAISAEDKITSEVMEQQEGLSRTEARDSFEQLKSFIEEAGGSDGIASAIQAGTLLAEPATVHRLGQWAQATSGNARILWLITPFETGSQTSAQLTVEGVIWTAIQTKAQFVSYICRPPRDGKSGALAMVYGLMLQLLEFQTADDGVCISSSSMQDILNEPNESWNTALDLLKMLLEKTPTLQYCMISGLNLIESGARDLCQEVVDVLLAHVRSPDCTVRLLFATSGQPRALFQNIATESMIMTKTTYRRKNRMVRHTGFKFPG